MLFFVGWDARETEAYKVCIHSLVRHATCPLTVHPLKHRALRKRGLFWREWKIDRDGQYWDLQDGRPFSTEFAFTRFLVPELAKSFKEDWAFFVDADFVFVEDVARLEGELDPSKAVMVVKHQHQPVNAQKMDGVIQTSYPRKNWSSLIAFNLRHPSNAALTPEAVNTEPGSFLHGFGWLRDEEIGALRPGWNWLVGHSPDEIDPLAYHFTDGGPWFDDWTRKPLDAVWEMEHRNSLHPLPTTVLKLQGAA